MHASTHTHTRKNVHAHTHIYMHIQFSLLSINFINCLRVVNVPRFMLVQMTILGEKFIIKQKYFLTFFLRNK